MQAVQIHAFNAVSDLAPRDVDRPVPARGEVLVAVDYAAINPSDVKNFQGMMAQTTLPRIIGRDFSGTIVEGPAHRIGEKVWGTGGDLGFTRDGTNAEFLVVPEEAAVVLPAHLAPEHAAALGVPFVTAISALDPFGADLTDKKLLIVGGTGAVGSAVTLIARKRGATIIRTTRGAKTIDLLDKSLREGDFIDLEFQSDLKRATLDLTAQRGVDCVMNLVGGPTFEPALESLAPFGKMICIASIPDHRVCFNLLQFYRKQNTLEGLNTLFLDSVESGRLLKKAQDELGTDLQPFGPIDLRDFKSAQEVYSQMIEGRMRKPVLRLK